MALARLRVSFVGPFVSFQDGGRFGSMRFGVPASGPMDRLAHATANAVLGNDAGATAIEVSRGGLVVDCVEGSVTVAVAGGGFVVDHAGTAMSSWTVLTLRQGERLAVRAGSWGSWCSVAVTGTFDVPTWLGSTSTHSMSGFGGGMLTAGREITISETRTSPDRDGEIPMPDIASPIDQVRVVLGPQDHHFEPAAVDALRSSVYRLTDAYDRMGVRLDGAPLALRDVLSIPSEPIVRGSIQVAGDGVPTVLLADHQTTGGYPKIATVVSADTDRFAQLRSGDSVRFVAVDPAVAVALARERAVAVAGHLTAIRRPGRTLTHRLTSENLISGAVANDDEHVGT